LRRGVDAGWVYFQIRNAVPHYFAESSTLSLCRHATRGPRSVVDADMTPARDDCPECWAAVAHPYVVTPRDYARSMTPEEPDVPPDPDDPNTPGVPPA
jgi:hypothetical protein